MNLLGLIFIPSKSQIILGTFLSSHSSNTAQFIQFHHLTIEEAFVDSDE